MSAGRRALEPGLAEPEPVSALVSVLASALELALARASEQAWTGAASAVPVPV